jgi:hypothetical protein
MESYSQILPDSPKNKMLPAPEKMPAMPVKEQSPFGRKN